jgi:serine/threonine protein kinase
VLHKIHRNSLRPGHRILWYRIDRVLGHGATGITYLATDTNLDRKVAIKEYLPADFAVRDDESWVRPISQQHSVDYEAGLERFIREGQVLDRFEHPNIVRVLNVFETSNTAYMVMNYERGQNLREILRNRQPLEENELLRILLPILDGLAGVHKQGFIHRDIKPSNIFIREDGSPVLLDFGSARHTETVPARTVTNFVSPGYAPIEQYASKTDQQGPWTDIYGLGATMYRAMTGLTPISATDRSAAIANFGFDSFTLSAEAVQATYSERLLCAVDHALQFKAADRPQTVAAWRTELDGLIPAEELIWEPTVPLPRSEKELVPTKVIHAHGDGNSIPATETTLGYLGHLAEYALPGFKTLMLASLLIGGFIALAIWTRTPSVEPEITAEAETPAVATEIDTNIELARSNLDAALDRIDEQVADWKARRRSGLEAVQSETEFDAAWTTNDIAFGAGSFQNEAELTVAPPTVPSFHEQAASVVAFYPESERTPMQARETKPQTAMTSGVDARMAELLRLADADIRAVRLSTPAGNNALEKYQRVLAFDPDNAAATSGIKRIVAEYIRLMDHALAQGGRERAERYFQRAQGIAPDSELVRRARLELNKHPRTEIRVAAADNDAPPTLQKRVTGFFKRLGAVFKGGD